MIKYINQERARYWPVSSDLMAEYKDGSHTEKGIDGKLIWERNGKIHRDGDKPAYIGANGYGGLSWWQNGLMHRDSDNPAWIGKHGTLEWWQNGERHRFRGPAVINSDGETWWWINDEDITDKVKKWLNREPWCGTSEQIVEFKLKFL